MERERSERGGQGRSERGVREEGERRERMEYESDGEDGVRDKSRTITVN